MRGMIAETEGFSQQVLLIALKLVHSIPSRIIKFNRGSMLIFPLLSENSCSCYLFLGYRGSEIVVQYKYTLSVSIWVQGYISEQVCPKQGNPGLWPQRDVTICLVKQGTKFREQSRTNRSPYSVMSCDQSWRRHRSRWATIRRWHHWGHEQSRSQGRTDWSIPTSVTRLLQSQGPAASQESSPCRRTRDSVSKAVGL